MLLLFIIEKCSLLTNTVLEMPVINFLFVDGSAAYPQSPLFFTAILYDLFYDLCSLSLFNFGKLFLICHLTCFNLMKIRLSGWVHKEQLFWSLHYTRQCRLLNALLCISIQVKNVLVSVRRAKL